jgi:hemoglobin
MSLASRLSLSLSLCLVAACGSSKGHPQPASTPASTAATPAASPEAASPAPAASPGAPATASKPASLFSRLGGLPAITAVVEEFVGRTTSDARIKDRFFNTDATHLKKMLVEQVCAASGGGCVYTGRDMTSTHGGMVLVDAEWDALVEDLVGALDKFKVPEREKGELMGALGGMKPQVVAPTSLLHPIDAGKLAAADKLGASLKDPEAARLVAAAVVAGRRGQRSYAEQLFSRAELAVGAPSVASIAPTFRDKAPPRIATPVGKMAMDTSPQPRVAVGTSDDDDKGGAVLEGAILVDGMPLRGVGAVMLEPTSGKWKARTPKQRVVEQRGREFAPHVVAAPVGSTIAFPNFDSIFHNVFSLSSAAPFDLGLYRNGETRSVTFKKEGIVRIGCNLHSSMAAFIIVVSSPHYAVSDDAGVFRFKHLPPGTYKLKAWSEHSKGPTVSTVEVKPGTNQISVAIAADAPAFNPDKFGDAR